MNMAANRYNAAMQTGSAKPFFFDLDPDELASHVQSWGMRPFRAKQILQWVYTKGVADPQQMTDLAQADRDLLQQNMRFLSGQLIAHQQASDGVQKLLLGWQELLADDEKPQAGLSRDATGNLSLSLLSTDSGRQTECVMIPAEGRRTACISSQVGCPVGCRFCASGLGGLDSHLTSGQIVEQVWRLSHLPDIERISNVVFMGMGEPLSNFNNVVKAIDALRADWGMGISGRRITVSTVGLPAQIRRFADRKVPATLAISLHAPNDKLRRQLIPWAEHVTVQQLIDAGRYYFDKTGREVTLEYVLLGGVNDQPEHAAELAQVAKTIRSNINLIRYNEVDGLPYLRPNDDDVRLFQQHLRDRNVNVHIRASRGRDIDAACGQLRHEHAKVSE